MYSLFFFSFTQKVVQLMGHPLNLMKNGLKTKLNIRITQNSMKGKPKSPKKKEKEKEKENP